MTPEEEFAQKRAQAEQLIRQHAPARLQEQLIALLRPAIALTATRTEDAQIAVGASKFGGAPDVPIDFEWPMWNGKPLGFLAQINLEEVAPFDVEGLLPKSGLLSFFYDLKEQPWGRAEERQGWRVFFSETKSLFRNSTKEGLNAASIALSSSFTIPDDFECFPELGLTIDDCIRNNDWTLLDELAKFIPTLTNQMLGHARTVQRHPGTEVESSWLDFQNHGAAVDWEIIKAEADKWILLFQMDSESNVDAMWGDCGTIYFMILPEDLAARNFSNVWFTLQCT